MAPILLAAAGALLYVAFAPPTADLAAASFRADLFEREGFGVFSTAWYGGHHTPGYSVLHPPLAALLGVRVLGALCVVAAAAAFVWLGGRTAALLAVPAILASLVSGRGPFTLGLALGVAAVAAAVHRREVVAAALAFLTALASPVAALFVGIAAAALVLADPGRRRAGLVTGAAATVPVVFLVVAFPEGGTFPFVVSAFVPCVLAAAGIAWIAGPGSIRTGAILFGLLCIAAFVVPSPVGGNAVRLGSLAVAPLAFHFLWPHRRVALALLALPIAYWVLQPAVRDALRTIDDPSVARAFHRPLVDFLETRQPARVEIAFTQNHWEARWVAAKLPIARGWERQVDRERNALFYEGELTPERYEAWLRENAIAYVAVPQRVPLDASAEDEAVLAQSGVPFLREERAGLEDWRVFAVVDPAPLAEGPARLTKLGPDSFTLDFARPGRAIVKVQHTPYWRIGNGCVSEAPGKWTEVEAKRAGTVEVDTDFALGRVSRTNSRCDGG